MSTTLLRIPHVIKRRGRSRSQLYSDIQSGLMTPPVRVGLNISVWPDYEIQQINAAEIAGSTRDEIKALVKQLIEQRVSMKPAIGKIAA